MENENIEQFEPDVQSTYQTGSTKPPKNRSGLVAILLIAVIFLAGISSILGLMNIHLFSALKKDGNGPLSLSDGNAATRPTQATISDLAPSVPTDKVTIQMVQTPTVGEDQQPAPGLPLQQIYINNIPSVVSISCVSNNGRSSGTGVVVSENGFIVTNHHVIEDAEAISVLLSDDRTFRATLVGSDAISDLAVIYVEAEDLTPAQFGNSNDLMVGDSVCAIGDPLGSELRGTMTNGIVSAINRDITTGGRTMTLIQTNAALNSGNSGGPLINCHGHVIGINTMKIGDNMSTAGVEGLGFAIPSATVVDVISQIMNQGYVSGRPAMGISGEPVSALYQYYYRLPAGLYINEVAPGSNAEAQGLEAGDILISLDGTAVSTDQELAAVLYGYQVGDQVQALIYRNQKRYTVTLTVEEAKK